MQFWNLSFHCQHPDPFYTPRNWLPFSILRLSLLSHFSLSLETRSKANPWHRKHFSRMMFGAPEISWLASHDTCAQSRHTYPPSWNHPLLLFPFGVFHPEARDGRRICAAMRSGEKRAKIARSVPSTMPSHTWHPSERWWLVGIVTTSSMFETAFVFNAILKLLKVKIFYRLT